MSQHLAWYYDWDYLSQFCKRFAEAVDEMKPNEPVEIVIRPGARYLPEEGKPQVKVDTQLFVGFIDYRPYELEMNGYLDS